MSDSDVTTKGKSVAVEEQPTPNEATSRDPGSRWVSRFWCCDGRNAAPSRATRTAAGPGAPAAPSKSPSTAQGDEASSQSVHSDGAIMAQKPSLPQSPINAKALGERSLCDFSRWKKSDTPQGAAKDYSADSESFSTYDALIRDVVRLTQRKTLQGQSEPEPLSDADLSEPGGQWRLWFTPATADSPYVLLTPDTASTSLKTRLDGYATGALLSLGRADPLLPRPKNETDEIQVHFVYDGVSTTQIGPISPAPAFTLDSLKTDACGAVPQSGDPGSIVKQRFRQTWAMSVAHPASTKPVRLVNDDIVKAFFKEQALLGHTSVTVFVERLDVPGTCVMVLHPSGGVTRRSVSYQLGSVKLKDLQDHASGESPEDFPKASAGRAWALYRDDGHLLLEADVRDYFESQQRQRVVHVRKVRPATIQFILNGGVGSKEVSMAALSIEWVKQEAADQFGWDLETFDEAWTVVVDPEAASSKIAYEKLPPMTDIAFRDRVQKRMDAGDRSFPVFGMKLGPPDDAPISAASSTMIETSLTMTNVTSYFLILVQILQVADAGKSSGSVSFDTVTALAGIAGVMLLAAFVTVAFERSTNDETGAEPIDESTHRREELPVYAFKEHKFWCCKDKWTNCENIRPNKGFCCWFPGCSCRFHRSTAWWHASRVVVVTMFSITLVLLQGLVSQLSLFDNPNSTPTPKLSG